MAVTALLPCLLLTLTAATPLDDYVSKPEPDYAWRDTGKSVWPLAFGGRAHLLNVTSLSWLDTSKAMVVPKNGGANTSVWTHQVAVVVPKTLTVTNVSIAVLTGGCVGDADPTLTDEYLELADKISANTGAIAVVVYQIPNCPMVYPSDPSGRKRQEDAMIAWAWYQYLQRDDHDPEWLPRLPMAKAGFQCMRAVGEWAKQQSIAEIGGWVVSGASKRGWTSWMVGAATNADPNAVNIVGLAPLVPIVPNIVAEVHRQWRSYGGFTFAFDDYTAVNFTTYLDGAQFGVATRIMDPMYYGERLARLPKVVVLSSDDEFMQFDWSDIWYDALTGDKHLLIAPDSEHSLASGIPEVVETISATFNAIAAGRPLPSFAYARDNATGALSVTLPAGVPHGKVVLRHAQTLTSERRDFRWVRLANNDTGACTLPDVPLKKPVDGGNCLQPVVWLGTTLDEDPSTPGLFTATPPEPKNGHWTGYYIEVYFPQQKRSATAAAAANANQDGASFASEFQFTTPGFAWPNTLPFADCHGDSCVGRLV